MLISAFLRRGRLDKDMCLWQGWRCVITATGRLSFSLAPDSNGRFISSLLSLAYLHGRPLLVYRRTLLAVATLACFFLFSFLFDGALLATLVCLQKQCFVREDLPCLRGAACVIANLSSHSRVLSHFAIYFVLIAVSHIFFISV